MVLHVFFNGYISLGKNLSLRSCWEKCRAVIHLNLWKSRGIKAVPSIEWASGELPFRKRKN